MSTFIQMVVAGRINSKRHTAELNDVLAQLQSKGASIKNVVLATTKIYGGLMEQKFGTEAVHIITYEANSPISI